jgi:hypothetical protein
MPASCSLYHYYFSLRRHSRLSSGVAKRVELGILWGMNKKEKEWAGLCEDIDECTFHSIKIRDVSGFGLRGLSLAFVILVGRELRSSNGNRECSEYGHTYSPDNVTVADHDDLPNETH